MSYFQLPDRKSNQKKGYFRKPEVGNPKPEIKNIMNRKHFKFQYLNFQLPVYEKQLHFRFDFRTESWKYDVANAEGELYTPFKFHPNRLSHLWEKGTAQLNDFLALT